MTQGLGAHPIWDEIEINAVHISVNMLRGSFQIQGFSVIQQLDRKECQKKENCSII